MTAPRRPAPARPDRMFDGYAFDLDGTVYLDDTVYLGDQVLPGAVEGVQRLRRAGRRVVFVTNKPLGTAAQYAAKLTGMGIFATTADGVTAADALLAYLRGRHPGATILPVAEPSLHRMLRGAGFALTADPASAQVVVVSFDRTFDYAKLNATYRAVRLHGAVIVATNPDPFCPTPDGGLPDCATMLAAVEASTGARAEAITGKPSQHMAGAVLDRLGDSPEAAAMVGDRLSTDMAMASSTGMAGILVLSGAAEPADLDDSPGMPRFVIDDLSQLLPG